MRSVPRHAAAAGDPLLHALAFPGISCILKTPRIRRRPQSRSLIRDALPAAGENASSIGKGWEA